MQPGVGSDTMDPTNGNSVVDVMGALHMGYGLLANRSRETPSNGFVYSVSTSKSREV